MSTAPGQAIPGIDYTFSSNVIFVSGTTYKVQIPNKSSSATFTITPIDDFPFEGTESVTLTLVVGTTPNNYNLGTPGSATATIADNDSNHAPAAQNGTLTTAEDTAASGTAVATDRDGQTLTYSIVSGPSHGTLSFNTSTGAYTYTPAANYNGTDSFTFKASDGSLDSNTATVSITVNAVADLTARTTVSAPTKTRALSDSVATNDSTTSGGTLTYAKASDPATAR